MTTPAMTIPPIFRKVTVVKALLDENGRAVGSKTLLGIYDADRPRIQG